MSSPSGERSLWGINSIKSERSFKPPPSPGLLPAPNFYPSPTPMGSQPSACTVLTWSEFVALGFFYSLYPCLEHLVPQVFLRLSFLLSNSSMFSGVTSFIYLLIFVFSF